MTDEEKIDALHTYAKEAFTLIATLWLHVGEARHVPSITEKYDELITQLAS